MRDSARKNRNIKEAIFNKACPDSGIDEYMLSEKYPKISTITLDMHGSKGFITNSHKALPNAPKIIAENIDNGFLIFLKYSCIDFIVFSFFLYSAWQCL